MILAVAQVDSGQRVGLERVETRVSMLLPLKEEDPNYLEPQLDVEVFHAPNSDSYVDQVLR